MALLGMGAISGGVVAYFVGLAKALERLLLVAGGIVLVYPNILVSLVGLAVVIAIGVLQYLTGRRGKTDPDQLEGSPA
jgi:TRAP-type uncharacterized transport system fused permease subunit